MSAKTKKEQIHSLRGMNDIKAQESRKYEYFMEVAIKVAKKYGFEFIQTPVLEQKSLFVRSVGDSSDIVSKEMYEFVDKGENNVCLRPEGTAGVVRSFLQDKQDKAGGVSKYFYHGQMFRYERPQKGRLRCFHQFGFESFGEVGTYEDANIILALCEIFKTFDIEFDILLNSLGCDRCASAYKAKLLDILKGLKGLCNDCNHRIDTNPLRVFDCKNQDCKNILSNVPKITDELCESCEAEFNHLQKILKNNNIKFNIDKNLVRGLDYYIKTAFEFTSNELGAQSAIAGGGRYDKLLSQLGGNEVSAIGCAIGFERISPILNADNIDIKTFYIGTTEEELLDEVFNTSIKARENLVDNTKVHTELKRRSFSKHLAISSKHNANKIAILKYKDGNSKEMQVWLKDNSTQKEDTLSINEFIYSLKL